MTILMSLKWEKGSKTWVAAILGRSRKFGLDREFLGPVQSTGKKTKEYIVDDGGLYEICELGKRSFLHVLEGKPKRISKAKMLVAIQAMEDKKAVEMSKVDDVIARFNQEGGFTLSDN